MSVRLNAQQHAVHRTHRLNDDRAEKVTSHQRQPLGQGD